MTYYYHDYVSISNQEMGIIICELEEGSQFVSHYIVETRRGRKVAHKDTLRLILR